MARRSGAFSIGVVVVLLIASVASARMLWIPVAGPMFKKAPKIYQTFKAPLVAPSGAAGSGTVKLDCNAGDDADRLVVKAGDLPRSVKCMLWFTDEKGKRLGSPFETAVDDEGRLHFTVFGTLCFVKEFPMLAVVINDKVALVADLRVAPLPPPGGKPASPAPGPPEPAPSPAPSASPGE